MFCLFVVFLESLFPELGVPGGLVNQGLGRRDGNVSTFTNDYNDCVFTTCSVHSRFIYDTHKSIHIYCKKKKKQKKFK